MKSKKRHQSQHSSSEESDDSDASEKSSSTSDSESEVSSVSEARHKKKRKRADSSDSDSDSENHKRSKKRKHKKKKKKHSKKKRRAASEESVSVEVVSSASEEEVSKKKRKHKHKHSKHNRDSISGEDVEVAPERRLHSVVNERRANSIEGSPPSRTYYQRDYKNSAPREDFEREREVQRFYRGSSKERRQYQERYQYEREHHDKYASYADKNSRPKFTSDEEYARRQREYDDYRRQHRYEERRSPEDIRRRPKEDHYHPRDDQRGFHQNRYNPNNFEERGPKRREYDNGRDFRERRGPPDPDRYREREHPDRKERFQDRYPPDRREPRRERPARPDIPPAVPRPREVSRSRSPAERIQERPKPKERSPRPRSPHRSPHRERRFSIGRDGRESKDGRDGREGRGSRPPGREQRPRERKSRFEDDSKEYSWGKTEAKKEGVDPGDKEKPNFGLSGKLTADANTVNGVVIKYAEPDDAKQPKRRWRFYPFKGDKSLPILYIHRQSAFLIGRDKKVADIPLEHPSVSKQHAALQYRATPFTRPDGSQGRRVRPYIIDLESANGTFVNNKKIEARRYVELLERDVVKFGFSAREYVLLHENSKDDAQDDDAPDPVDIGANITTAEELKIQKHLKQEIAEDGE